MSLFDRETIEVDIRIWNQLKTFLPNCSDVAELVSLAEKRHEIRQSEKAIQKEIEQLDPKITIEIPLSKLRYYP